MEHDKCAWDSENGSRLGNPATTSLQQFTSTCPSCYLDENDQLKPVPGRDGRTPGTATETARAKGTE